MPARRWLALAGLVLGALALTAALTNQSEFLLVPLALLLLLLLSSLMPLLVGAVLQLVFRNRPVPPALALACGVVLGSLAMFAGIGGKVAVDRDPILGWLASSLLAYAFVEMGAATARWLKERFSARGLTSGSS